MDTRLLFLKDRLLSLTKQISAEGLQERLSHTTILRPRNRAFLKKRF